MKLGNRKVVIGGLAAVAFTSMTAFTNVTPDTTSDTAPYSLTTSVEYQSLTMAASSGIGKYSSLYMPGQVTTTLDAIVADQVPAGGKTSMKTQAGIAKIFTQSVTLAALETVNTESSTELRKTALNTDSVSENTAEAAGSEEVSESDTTEVQETVEEAQTEDTAEEVAQSEDTEAEDAQDVTEEDTSSNVSQQEVNEAIENAENTQTEIPDEEKLAAAKDAEVKSEWSDKVMANVEESVNIRSDANEEAEVVGKLYKGAEGDILEKGDEWTKISSGSVTEGYVKNEYLAFDDEAQALAEQDGQLVATVNTDALRIREEASEDGAVLDMAENGEELDVIEEEGDWVEIQFGSDTSAFVSSQFVTVDYVLGTALTIEEEKAIQEEKARKEAEARMAEIANSEDAALLAAVVRMEAGGESYEGKLAVASVVVNRMNSGRYPSTVSGVVYQSGQFPGAANGTLANFLSSGVGGDCKKAAVEALAGITNVSYLHFNSVSRIGTDGYVIGNHCFY
ncbi:cell wall hydrolase [Konateibacter massiliensis]|uniref:cell wall hydrolase n=1 Tax=Konateibacter massiliensis TaxID=2002841 RepID=UPI000C15228F|nr:cell wall hydrolase [Konateibacter massiliensis]